jgi:hypothetical protein
MHWMWSLGLSAHMACFDAACCLCHVCCLQSPDQLAVPSVRNDAAFLFSVTGVCLSLLLLAPQGSMWCKLGCHHTAQPLHNGA